MSKEYTTCNRCGKAIYYGNAYLTIVRNIEQAEENLTTSIEQIQVIDSEEIITFCGSCGNSFDASTIANIINAIPTDQNRITDN